ncbi:MAG: glycosyltransferase family 4 protein [Actinomycetota bacterium]
MKPLRIALVHPFAWPEVRRGGERYLADLAWYLTRAGHRVDVITGTAGEPATRVEDGATMRRLRHLSPGPMQRRGYGEAETFGIRVLPTLLRRRGYDIVHAFTPTAAIAARLTGHRTLYTVLGHPARELVVSLPRESRLMRRAIRSASLVAALSEASARATEDSFGRRAEVLPPGVIIDRFPLRGTPRTGPPRVLFPAFASNPEKGLGTLVEAFATLLDRRPDARLVLAGPGDSGWAFDRLGSSEGGRVRAAADTPGVGRLEDLPARYAGSTLTALPSTNEAFGLILVESLACGTPVVCGADGGMPEIVDSPTIGRTAPFGDARSLARAIDETIDLAADPATPGHCRTRSLHYDWEKRVGPMHEAIYARITGSAPSG